MIRQLFQGKIRINLAFWELFGEIGKEEETFTPSFYMENTEFIPHKSLLRDKMLQKQTRIP